MRKNISGLENLEVEMTDDPGAGFMEYFQHSSSKSLTTLVLQIMYIPAKYLQALVDNCTNLQVPKDYRIDELRYRRLHKFVLSFGLTGGVSRCSSKSFLLELRIQH
jgi:hypothetical protein